MKKKNLVKFDELEIEVLSSECELAAINGGKNAALEILEILLGGGVNINGNCGCKSK